jgi:hypothetical protein
MERSNMQQYPYAPQPRQKFWTKGKAAIIIAVVIVFGIAIAGVAMKLPLLEEGSSIFIGFDQELYKEGDDNPTYPDSNQVTFPYSNLLCQTNKSCSVIFASISGKVIEVRRYMGAGANDKIWRPDGSTNTLTTIEPYIAYFVKVSTNCTLQLDSCLPQ